MPKNERPDESAARKVVEARLGVQLRFADTTGGVDYVFEWAGAPSALEVTRLTDRREKEGMKVWANRYSVRETHLLRHSWWVVTEGHPQYSTVYELIVPALQELELHQLQEYSSQMDWWLEHSPTLRDAVQRLRSARVSDARHISTKGEVRQVLLSPSGGWVSDGPNGALEELENFLASASDVLEKLRSSAAHERHAWIWTDTDTPGRVRRPLESTEWGLPTRAPSLPDEITHLWVVDEQTGNGWTWFRVEGWSTIP